MRILSDTNIDFLKWRWHALLVSGVVLTAGIATMGARGIPLGIACGLFVGKQLGVFGAAWFLIRMGACRMPAGASWLQLYGTCVLTGIGFTMSLFIGGLAYGEGGHDVQVRIGVLAGSVVSAIVGVALLGFVRHTNERSYGTSTA